MDTNALIRQRQQQLDQIYNPQIELIQQQKQALPGRFDARRSALEQARVNAFRDIGQTANRRGMFFSGFQPQEQARFLGERFLPGMQDIESQQEQARLGLLEQLTGIRGQRAQGMMSFQDQIQQQQQRQQEQERQFQQQRQLQQEQQRFQAGRASAGRAAAGAGQAQAAAAEVQNEIRQRVGSDGYLSPSVFASIYGTASQFGLDRFQVGQMLANRINPSHWQQYARAVGIGRGAGSLRTFQQILSGSHSLQRQ